MHDVQVHSTPRFPALYDQSRHELNLALAVIVRSVFSGKTQPQVLQQDTSSFVSLTFRCEVWNGSITGATDRKLLIIIVGGCHDAVMTSRPKVMGMSVFV